MNTGRLVKSYIDVDDEAEETTSQTAVGIIDDAEPGSSRDTSPPVKKRKVTQQNHPK